jgi:hypothetical protein
VGNIQNQGHMCCGLLCLGLMVTCVAGVIDCPHSLPKHNSHRHAGFPGPPLCSGALVSSRHLNSRRHAMRPVMVLVDLLVHAFTIRHWRSTRPPCPSREASPFNTTCLWSSSGSSKTPPTHSVRHANRLTSFSASRGMVAHTHNTNDHETIHLGPATHVSVISKPVCNTCDHECYEGIHTTQMTMKRYI